MKRFKCIILAFIIASTVGCQDTGKSSIDYTVVIPEEDRYMFDSELYSESLPDKNDIVKVAFSTFNDPQDSSGVWLVLYEQIDFEEKTISYWDSKSGRIDGIKKTQEIVLSDDDINVYRDAVNYECLKTPVNYEDRFWKIAILYKDGSHYAYTLTDGYKKGTSENDMIRCFSDKFELTDYEKFILGL